MLMLLISRSEIINAVFVKNTKVPMYCRAFKGTLNIFFSYLAEFCLSYEKRLLNYKYRKKNSKIFSESGEISNFS